MTHPIKGLAEADAILKASKPGWKTTEFLIAVVLVSAGMVLCYTGHVEQGSKVLGYVGAGYIAARTINKAMLSFKSSTAKEKPECKDKLL